MVKQHPLLGEELLRDASNLPETTLRIIKEHHEAADGGGYPLGLKGAQIYPSAKLCRVVDQFDSLTSPQPFRAALTPIQALKKMHQANLSNQEKALLKKFIGFLGSGKG